jgi:hypothetical protein
MSTPKTGLPALTAETEVEIGWSPHSGPHWVVGRDGTRARTVCGKVLSGLSDNRWLSVASIGAGRRGPRSEICNTCRGLIARAAQKGTGQEGAAS